MQQAEIAGHPRHPQKMLHHIADSKPLGAALDHFADRAALHRLAERKGRNVGFHVVHAPAHIRIDRQPAIGNAHVAFVQSGRGQIDQFEIARHGHAVGAGFQAPGAGHQHSSIVFSKVGYAVPGALATKKGTGAIAVGCIAKKAPLRRHSRLKRGPGRGAGL
jgi:hypothetical protein